MSQRIEFLFEPETTANNCLSGSVLLLHRHPVAYLLRMTYSTRDIVLFNSVKHLQKTLFPVIPSTHSFSSLEVNKTNMLRVLLPRHD